MATNPASFVVMPPNIARLDRDRHGRPIPWFVHIQKDGTPDFRLVRHNGIHIAYQYGLCWVCGLSRNTGGDDAFVIGPMCVVNLVAPEPPSHRECAIYSAIACPFVANPRMRRRDRNLPDTLVESPGTPILRNPGVAVVWVSRTWKPVRVDNGVLFDVGVPTQVQWYTEGRRATRAEAEQAFDSGFPALLEVAQRVGPTDVKLLQWQAKAARSLFPDV